MRPHYLDEHSIFVDSIRKLITSEFAPHVSRWEEEGFYPDTVFETLGAHGFLGIMIPEKDGGIGGDYRMAAAWCESFGELRSVGLTIGVNMHSLVVSHALAKFGTEAAKKKWLLPAIEGKAIGAYAFTEPGAGSDLASLATRAEKKGSRWIINGAKTFITNGARAHFILVLARTDSRAGYGGFTTFLVDTRSPGFKVSKKLDKLGWRASDTAELLFENVEVEEECILGKLGEGWHQATANLNWERMMLTLTTLGGARACLRDAVRYSKDRKTFGKPILEHGAINHMVARMAERIILGEALCEEGVALLHPPQESCRSHVSMSKRLVCDDLVWLCDRAIQIHGGYGYTTEFSPERWWRDLRLMPIGGGTSEVMANIVLKDQNWFGE